MEDHDTTLYLEWRIALGAGDVPTAAVIFGLFRPPLQSYLDTAPVDDFGLPIAPPFDDPDYDVVIQRNEAERLDADSREQAAASRRATERAARYGGLGIIFASVLAAVGIAGRFDDLRLRRILTVSAVVLFCIGVVFFVTSPVTIG